MPGDEDEEDIDDLEHEFNIDDEKQKQLQQDQDGMQNSHITKAMLHGKMSYGRGPDDGDGNSTPLPPIITGARSVPVHTTHLTPLTPNSLPLLTSTCSRNVLCKKKFR